MHRILQDFEENHRQVLDRLVDGELSELERKELLSALDDEPAGWRQCALAFLEAQSWGTDLKAFRHEPQQPLTASANAGTHAPWRFASLGLAMAASLLVAFFGGIALQQRFGSQPGAQQLAQQNRPSTAGPQADRVATASAEDLAWQTIQLTADDGSALEVKAIDGRRGDPSWMLDYASAIPADVLEELRQQGHRVEREKQLWPVQLQDGRRLILPIEQVQVHYVGNESYQ